MMTVRGLAAAIEGFDMRTRNSLLFVFAVVAPLMLVESAQAYFHPGTGRFISRDPYSELGFRHNQTLTRIQAGLVIERGDEAQAYHFTLNSPTNLVDLLGLKTILVSGIDPGNLDPNPSNPTNYLNACGYGGQPGAEKCGSHVTGGSILLGGGLDIKGHLEGDAERNKDCVSNHLGCKGCPCSKQRSIAIVIIAPKTTHTPQIDCKCCKLTFYILYDHEDIVPNGSQWAWDPGNTIFGNGFWKDNFTSGSCVSGTAIDVDFRDIPSHGTGFGLGGGVASGGVTDIHPHGGIWSGFNPKIPFCDEIAKLRASHDDLIMCHSQGCNITMHAVNESCKQP